MELIMTHDQLIEEIKGIQRIVINTVHGGFGLSEQAIEIYKERRGITDPDWYERDIARDDPVLVAVVRELGADADTRYDKHADTRYAKLKIVEVPYGVDWTIEEYDGVEWVAEKHRTWR
jgi:hypothetical protein